MRRTRIKICGITDPAAAIAAAEAGVDAIGLVFVNASPRHVDLAQAQRIVHELPSFVTPVALFVDTPVEQMRRIIETLHIRTVQLHGREGPGIVQAMAPFRVIKSLPFNAHEAQTQVHQWRRTASNLAAILWDTPPSNARLSSSMTGGSGHSFDWHALSDFQRDGGMDGLPPTILAGGLHADNVGDAIALLQPFAVDVSSGVESAPGRKDPARIQEFCQAVLEADHRYSLE